VPEAIAVLDIGKTTAKLVAIDARTGATLDSRARATAALPGPPYPHADVDGLWHFLLDGLAAFAETHRITGVSLTTHGCAAALVDGDGALALPVLDYEHAGPDALDTAYAAVRPPFAESLTPRLPGGLNLGAQLFWQARAFPEAFARIRTILTYPQFWAWKLSGVAVSEVTSLGCHSDLWAPATGGFSTLVARQGWAPLFPPLRPAASTLGPILPEIAAVTGLAAGTPVACGIHDSNASLLPWLRRLAAPFTVVSSGTWTIVMTVGGPLDRLDPARDSLANVDAEGRPVPTARFMGGREYAALLGPDPVPASAADLGRVLARGTLPLPPFVPGVGPFPHGPGRWHGDPGRLAPAERTAAADLYLALVTDACVDLAGRGAALVVEGPLARNLLYCRLLAALAGVPVHPSPDATGTAAGAARLLADLPPPELPAPVSPLALEGLPEVAGTWRGHIDQEPVMNERI
jgi:sugar (pentulose or hexulose) kinase